MDLQQHTEIEKYLDKEMSDPERSAFEKRLQADPQLVEALKEHQEARFAIRAFQEANDQKAEDKSQEIRGWVKEAFEEDGGSGVIKKPHWYKKPAWAGLAAACMAMLIIFPFFRSPSMLKIYNKNFTMPTPATLLGGGTDTTQLSVAWQAALETFESGDCPAAITEMEALLKNPDFKKTHEAHFYIGTCLLKEKQTQAAIDHLKTIPPDAGVYQEAQWYIALAYLQAEEKEKALKAFSAIADQKTSERWKQAEKIRELLD